MRYVEKHGNSYDYHSTQIDLLNERRMLEFGNSLIPDDLIYNDEDNKYGRENEPHVTLLYGLVDSVKVSDVQRLIYGEEFGPFNIQFGGISSFRGEDNPYDVLKIDIISEPLKKLHYILRENLPNENTFPEYCPHFTLAYIKKDSCKDIEEQYKQITDRRIQVNKLMFSHKDGYKVPIHMY